MLRKIETGGARNEQPLTREQKQAAFDFAAKLNMPLDKIAYSDNYYTGYNPGFDILLIGTDLFPIDKAPQGTRNANSRVSWKSAIGHELIGHREAALKGWAQSDKQQLLRPCVENRYKLVDWLLLACNFSFLPP